MQQLRLVIMDAPYAAWDDPRVRALFTAMVTLKRDGFRPAHGDRYVPVGDWDFLACHQLLCMQAADGALVPLIGNHTTTLEVAAYHRLPFPALALARACDAPDHAAAIEAIVERCTRTDRRLGYDAGWTISPAAREAGHAAALHRAFRVIKTLFLHHHAIDEMLTSALLRFRVERTCAHWGYAPLERDDQALPPVPVPRLDGEPILFVHMRALRAEALTDARAYQRLWDDRLVLGPPPA